MPPKRRIRKWEEDMKKKTTKSRSRIIKRGKWVSETGKSILEIPQDVLLCILTMAVGKKNSSPVALTCKMFRDLLKKKPIRELTFNMNIDQITNSVEKRIHNLGDQSVKRVHFLLDAKVEFSLDENVKKISGLKELKVELLNRDMEEDQTFCTSDYMYSFKHPTVKRLSLKISNGWDIDIPDILKHLEENLVLKFLKLSISVDYVYDYDRRPNHNLESLISFLGKNYERYNVIQIIINDDKEKCILDHIRKYFKKNASFMELVMEENAFIRFICIP